MKNKLSENAFSKMYMVGPAVYNKLLNCIDEIDKKETADLNTEEKEQEQRPAEKYLAQLNNNSDMQPPQGAINDNRLEIPQDDQSSSDQIISNEERYGPPIMENGQVGEVLAENNGPANDFTTPVSQTPEVKTNFDNPLNKPCQDTSACGVNKPITNLNRKPAFISSKNRKITSLPPINTKTSFKSERYECDICGKTVAKKYGLERHRLALHKDVFPTKESAKVYDNSKKTQSNSSKPVIVTNGNSHEAEVIQDIHGNSNAENLGQEMEAEEEDFENWQKSNINSKRFKRPSVIVPMIRKPIKRSLRDTDFITSSRIPYKKTLFEQGIKRTSTDAKLPKKPTKKFQAWNE